MIRTSLATLSLLAFALFANTATADKHQTTQPEAVALIFHADWCGSCKAMDPKIKEARKDLGDASALFVVLDLTD